MPKPKIHPLKIEFEIPVSEKIKIPRFVYLYIIEGEKLHLIDTGVAAAFNILTAYLKRTGRDITEIENVFFTHSHPDHIGAAKFIQQKVDCKFFSTQKELEWINNTQLQFQKRPIPGFHSLVEGSVNNIIELVPGHEIELENNCTLKAIPTPGHSAGSTSFHIKELNVLFTGDAILLPGEIPIFENVKYYLSSLENIAKMNPEVIYSSWDKPRKSEEIQEIINQSKNYILHIQKTVRQVAPEFSEHNSIKFCEAVLQKLGKGKELANPLLLKSFLACLTE